MSSNRYRFHWTKYCCTLVTLVFLSVFLVLPLILVFIEAFRGGINSYIAAITEADARAAVLLTLFVAAVTVPLNTFFGNMAAWALTKFDYRGKSLLLTLIDLPFVVPPVIAGLIFILMLGSNGVFGPWLKAMDITLIFAPPAIFIATFFITFPFIVRELVPLMQEQGRDEEEAAISLGAGALKTFWLITLPNIKWALLHGIILCNARAMGEFGAVSVVSGHIRGSTITMPLHIEILYNEYNFSAAFAVASLLAMLALVTLLIKSLLEWRLQRERRGFAQHGPTQEGTLM
ncbi:MAG: sulfate ABC transporter permease subunit CysW [Candidatus Hydrogenedentes bacterium]|nr:sulfate ABC transporter permease subunit CysW [Candidatus Hydrogenedentota bacterium]